MSPVPTRRNGVDKRRSVSVIKGKETRIPYEKKSCGDRGNVHDDHYRPQPRLDRDADGGMATSAGRIRQELALPNGIKYLLVSHNSKIGAAKGAVLTAEHLVQTGYI
jgi:aspartate-semialdehyde dehydrogenase